MSTTMPDGNTRDRYVDASSVDRATAPPDLVDPRRAAVNRIRSYCAYLDRHESTTARELRAAADLLYEMTDPPVLELRLELTELVLKAGEVLVIRLPVDRPDITPDVVDVWRDELDRRVGPDRWLIVAGVDASTTAVGDGSPISDADRARFAVDDPFGQEHDG